MRLLREYRIDLIAHPWAGWTSFYVPGAESRALALPDGRLSLASTLGPIGGVPEGARKIAVRPGGAGVVALLPDETLMAIDRHGVELVHPSERRTAVEAIATDTKDRVWITRRSGADDELMIELLDDRLDSSLALPLGLFSSQGSEIRVDPSGTLVAVNSHYGQDGSLLTMLKLAGDGLTILETWPSPDAGAADSFEIDGFHATSHQRYRESPNDPRVPYLVAKFRRAIEVVLCPDIAVGIGRGIDEEQVCSSARVFGESLWLALRNQTTSNASEVYRVDPSTMEVVGSVDLDIPDGHELEVVGEGLILTASSEAWSQGYSASLFAIDV